MLGLFGEILSIHVEILHVVTDSVGNCNLQSLVEYQAVLSSAHYRSCNILIQCFHDTACFQTLSQPIFPETQHFKSSYYPIHPHSDSRTRSASA